MTTENQAKELDQQNQSGDQDSQSEVEKLKQENERLKQENERIRKEELDKKTSSAYLKDKQIQAKQQREAKLLNQNLPPAQRLTKEQMDDMTIPDIIDYVNRSAQRVYSHVTREKIVPLLEQDQDDSTRAQLERLNEKVPDWQEFLEDMKPIAIADPSLNAEEVLRMAVAKRGNMKRLQEINDLLQGKKPEQKKEEPLMPKEPKRPVIVSGGEKPSVSVGKVTTTQKAMTPREAARKAYEDMKNSGG